MSSIPGTNSGAYGNPYSSASSRSAEEEEEKTAAAADKAEETARTEEETKALTDYKRDFVSRVKALMSKAHLANVGLELNISDAGYERMMKDSAYEQSVLDKLQSRTAHSYTPVSGTVALSANGTDEPAAVLAESRTVSEILFSTSNRTLLRTLGIDGMISMAEETLSSLETTRSRFDMAGRLSSMQMRPTASYLDKYIESLNSIDTTG